MMERDRILEPYTRRVEDIRHRVSRVALIGGFVLLAMVIGFLTAILPLRLLLIPMAPAIVLALFALWLAPDLDTDYDLVVRKLWLMFLATSMVWPDYIAMTVPGIGWLSPQRLVMAILFFVSIYALATSSTTRAHVFDVVSHVKPVYWFILLFVVWQVLVSVTTLQFSGRFVRGFIFFYFVFVLAAWSSSKPNTMVRLCQIIVIGFAVQLIYGFLEYRLEYPFWAPYIPSWLQVDAELLGSITGFTARSATGVYRVGSLFFTSVTFAEAIGYGVPFVMFVLLYSKNTWLRMAAFALLIFAFMNAVWTDARTGMVAFLIGPVAMIGLWAVQRYRRLRGQADIVGPAVLWAYPFAMMLMALSVLFVQRVRVSVLGGGAHQASNDAREFQWNRTMELVQSNPIGHGPDNAGWRIGYVGARDTVSVDGYTMTLLVDFGVLGLLFFSLFFVGCIVVGVQTFLNSDNLEEDLAAPLAVTLIMFIFVRTISSQTEVFWLIFSLAGAIIGLHWRQQQRLKAAAEEQPPAPVEPAPTAPRRGPLVPSGGYGVAARG